MTNSVRVAPYLMVHDGAAALKWYARAFEATASEVYEHEGRLGHAELSIGGGTVMLSGEFPEYADIVGTASPKTLGGTTVTVNLTVDDVDAWWNRAVAEGAHPLRPPQDEFYGRHGKVRDPFGHVWSFVKPN